MNPEELPFWAELPPVDLYLDQVLEYMAGPAPSSKAAMARELTAAMVNNYVKHGYLDKPLKKRYSRRHLAALALISVFKDIFPIQDIARVQRSLEAEATPQEVYDLFVRALRPGGAPGGPQVVAAMCGALQSYRQAVAAMAAPGGQDGAIPMQ